MKKKIALIFIGNIEFCPYVKEYEKILGDLCLDYNIIFWKRESLTIEYPNNYYFFDFPSSIKRRKILKIFDFFKYALWMKKIINENSYTHLIFLDTLSGILAYLNRCIARNMYATLEIRDYTYEKIKLFKFVEQKMLHKMRYVFISSPAFIHFLPDFDYCITHNFNEKEYMQFCKSTEFVKKAKGEPLNIVYTGALKYFDYQKAIIEELKNDSKFNIIYHGIGPDYARLKKYCCDKNIKNIKFTGLYTEDQKPKFYEEADFIVNCYDIHLGSEILYALSNKYYDGLIYHIPQLSEDKTFKGGLVEKNKVGIAWRPEEGKLKKRLMNFYYSIDEENFNKTCVDKMENYYIEYKRYTEKIIDFLQH